MGRRVPEEVGVPRQFDRVAADNVEAALDDDGVQAGRERGDEATYDTQRARGLCCGRVGLVEEHADEEAAGDDGARAEYAQGRPRVQDDEGGRDGEGHEQAARYLIVRRVDELQRKVVEACGAIRRRNATVVVTHLRPMTLMTTSGARPLAVDQEMAMLNLSMRSIRHRKRSTTATSSCMKRKNNGVEDLFSTHLLLQGDMSATASVESSSVRYYHLGLHRMRGRVAYERCTHCQRCDQVERDGTELQVVRAHADAAGCSALTTARRECGRSFCEDMVGSQGCDAQQCSKPLPQHNPGDLCHVALS